MTINKHTKETDRKMFSFLMKSCSATHFLKFNNVCFLF